MSAVKKITPHLHSLTCPDDLRSLPAWVMWRYEQVPGEDKPRKVPYYASGKRRSGVQGSPEDMAQLVAFDAIVSAAARKGFDGVGITTLPDWGVTIVDFDRAVVNGALLPDVAGAASGTYAEFSPSGEGVHVVVKGSFPNKKNHGDKTTPGHYGVETFHSKGFVTWTGNPLPITEIMGAENTIGPMSEDLLQILNARLLTAREREQGERPRPAVEPMGLHHDQITECLEAIDPEEGGHDQWLRIGMAIHHETNGEGFDLWDEWSEKGATYPGRDNLQRRWDSFGRRPGGVTIRSLLKVAHQHGVDVGVIGADEDFEDLGPDPEAGKDDKAPAELSAFAFKLQPIHEFAAQPSGGWIVKNVIPRAELGIIYGASGSGKTFIILDIALAVARGVPWRGLRVKQGRVVYIVAEGAGGFRKRARAYAQQNGIDLKDVDVLVLDATPNLLDDKQVKLLTKAIEAAGAISMIVVDTFAQMTPGANENAAEDMGKAINHVRSVGRKVGACVVLVHHAGKDAAKGARGWSGLRAAADFELEVTRDGDNRTLNTTKQKDADDQEQWGFRLEEITIGIDEDGDDITSCVIAESDVTVDAGVNGGRRKAKPKEKMGDWERALLDVYAELSVGGDVRKFDLIAAAADTRPDAGTVKVRRGNVRAALKKMRTGKDSYFLPPEPEIKEDLYVMQRT
jgi:KaiC/GvpD/RAD55 family RecA-like ATPase